MTIPELEEFLRLKEWSTERLAAELEITADAIRKWRQMGKIPGAATRIVLRQWLDEARKEKRLAKAGK